MREVKFKHVLAAAKRLGASHWFDNDRNGSSNSSMPATAYLADDGSFWFVSSEQHWDADRKHTVRHMNPNGVVNTVGPYNEMTEGQAHLHMAQVWEQPHAQVLQ